MKYLPKKNINRVLLLNRAEDIDGSILTFILRLDKAFFLAKSDVAISPLC